MRKFYSLAKSGLVFGNLITVIGGFALASRGRAIDLPLLLAICAGMWLIMASGCAFNNYVDRDIDRVMQRTKDRVLVTGQISARSALIFASCLAAVGFLILAIFANTLTLTIAALGFFFYVVLYTLWSKRRSVWGTFVGAISGAAPPLVGYCAVSNRIDAAAIILFAILVIWQMPHFFAIGIRRASDYAAAQIPILPVTRGALNAKLSILLYIFAFILVAPLLSVFGYLGPDYFWVAFGLGVVWLAWGVKGFWAKDNIRWSRQMFFLSLVVMVALFFVMAVVSRDPRVIF